MILPIDIQRDWMASLSSDPIEAGHYYLIDIQRTAPGTYEEQRIIVTVLDENGIPIRVNVAFAFSTARQYFITNDYQWMPPAPHRAFVGLTRGGEIEHIQGSPVKDGQPGGVTVYVLDPKYSSDIVSGLGMLADHTGLHLTFQLARKGVKSTEERLIELAARVFNLENATRPNP